MGPDYQYLTLIQKVLAQNLFLKIFKKVKYNGI